MACAISFFVGAMPINPKEVESSSQGWTAPAQRTTYLAKACGKDEALRRRAEALFEYSPIAVVDVREDPVGFEPKIRIEG
jgi:hypothetical protein